MGFPSTQWSLILASGHDESSRAAWGELAGRYRMPIHAYFRARFGNDTADDLTNAFFAESIAGRWWARADAERGSFRTYLRVLLARFGARHVDVPLAGGGDASLLERVVDHGDGPEAAYDRAFAQAVVTAALGKLRVEGGDVARALWPLLLEGGAPGEIRALATDLGVNPNVLSQRLRRLKLRLRELLREEFAALVADPDLIDDELRSLQAALLRN